MWLQWATPCHYAPSGKRGTAHPPEPSYLNLFAKGATRWILPLRQHHVKACYSPTLPQNLLSPFHITLNRPTCLRFTSTPTPSYTAGGWVTLRNQWFEVVLGEVHTQPPHAHITFICFVWCFSFIGIGGVLPFFPFILLQICSEDRCMVFFVATTSSSPSLCIFSFNWCQQGWVPLKKFPWRVG